MSKPTYSNQALGEFFKNALQAQENHNYDEAEKFYSLILNQIPQHADSLHYLGLIKHEKKNNTEAIKLIRLAVNQNPDDLDALMNLSIILEEDNQFDAALNTYKDILKKNDRHALAHCGLAEVYKKLGKHDKFKKHCLTAYKLEPTSVKIISSYSNLLLEELEFKQAIDTLKAALNIDPKNSVILSSLIVTLYLTGHFEEANIYNVMYHDSDIKNQAGLTQKLFVCNYEPDIEADEIYKKHVQRASLFPAYNITPPPATIRSHQHNTRTRIAYVSANFHIHSVAFFFEPIIKNHDDKKFETYCYSNNNRGDSITECIKTHCHHWRNIYALDDKQLIQQIQDDDIDILVDLSGYSAGNRLGVFANRVCPIQITYLGYPNTTGLRTIDYRITDSYTDPVGLTEKQYTEKLARLDDIFLCFSPDKQSPDIVPSPAIKNGYVTFGSFNNMAKVNNRVIERWSEMLKKVPDSKLLIKSKIFHDKEIRKFTLSRFNTFNISRDRLILVGYEKNFVSHMAAYNEIDIALDPFPYNGTTTTCEALWMGVPVIALCGSAHISRVSASILHKLRLDKLIAKNQDEYVSIACNLSRALPELSKLRSTMRDRIEQNKFTDGITFTRSLEKLYLSLKKNK